MLLHRLAVAIPLIAVLTAIFACPPEISIHLFTALSVIMMALAIHETWQLTGHKKIDCYEVVLQIAGLLLTLSPYFSKTVLPGITCSHPLTALSKVSLPMLGEQVILGPLQLGTILFPIILFVAFCILFYKGPSQESLVDVAFFGFTAIYICLCLSFLTQIYLMYGPLMLGFLIVVTKLADVGAYFVGTGTAKLPGGNHKLAKQLSPKKSWEGLAGGIAFSILGAVIFWCFAKDSAAMQSLPLWKVISLGVIAPVVGLIGDLAESALKRVANAKDSGHIPGLGGILDMLDSLIPMGPIFLLLLAL